MRAVNIVDDDMGGSLRVEMLPEPEVGPDEVLIEVSSAGVNRADTLQRAGRYPPPPGASAIPGLECAGTIAAVGPLAAGRWHIGDRVCALLAGGGYAERVAAPAGQVLPVPDAISLVEAGALPETLTTVWANLFGLGRLSMGETVLVHGGASGVGVTAIQLARLAGAEVIVTVGNQHKADACLSLGARAAINYRTEDFVERVLDETGGRGADVVLDLVGADYAQRNIDVLAADGRLVIVGLQSGADATVNLGRIMAKRAVVTGSMLRPRPVSEKSALVAQVGRYVLPALGRGEVRPVVDAVFSFDEAMLAHARLTSPEHVGKVLLVP
ncbi:MAG: NAD(P)H-quinone oxidoreductase [Coriobacteriia bacterium]|nr:NAD(P)H-quinone oxidoreductase [Coriobacteriia bacterium]